MFLFSSIAVLIICAALAPAFAASAQKIPFSATQIPVAPPPPLPDYRAFVTEGNTSHTQNSVGNGKINSTLSVAWMTPNKQGDTRSTIQIVYNLKTGKGEIKFNMTWTFLTGSFQGNIIGKLSDPTPPFTDSYLANAAEFHGVLQGDGAFKGQTIVIDGTKAAGSLLFVWTVTLIVP